VTSLQGESQPLNFPRSD